MVYELLDRVDGHTYVLLKDTHTHTQRESAV